MTPVFRKWRWLWWLAASLVAAFLAVAGAGWFREKREMEVMRGRYQQYAADLRVRIDSVGDGISLAEFRAHLPEACEDRESDRWAVRIPRNYHEDLGFPTAFEVVRFLVAEDGGVKLDDAGGLVTSRTICILTSPKGLRYYFWRAWRSGLLDLDASPSA